MKKNLLVGTLALFVGLHCSSLMAEVSQEHQGHAPVMAKEESHGEAMAGKMAKISVKMEKMQKELMQAEGQMSDLKNLLAKIKQTAAGQARNQMLVEHGVGMRQILSGFRTHVEQMKGKMEKMMAEKPGMGGDKEHKDHDGGMGMMAGEMKEDREVHHKMMQKRLMLLEDLMGQMEGHLAVSADLK